MTTPAPTPTTGTVCLLVHSCEVLLASPLQLQQAFGSDPRWKHHHPLRPPWTRTASRAEIAELAAHTPHAGGQEGGGGASHASALGLGPHALPVSSGHIPYPGKGGAQWTVLHRALDGPFCQLQPPRDAVSGSTSGSHGLGFNVAPSLLQNGTLGLRSACIGYVVHIHKLNADSGLCDFLPTLLGGELGTQGAPMWHVSPFISQWVWF